MKRKFIAEWAGTHFLTMVVLGSGIMAQNLFPNQDGLALLANSLATGAGLFVLITCLAPVSGAHLNPVVTLFSFFLCENKNKSRTELIFYILAQFSGALSGILLTHYLFGLEIIQFSDTSRSGVPLLVSEVVATFGLLMVITLTERRNSNLIPATVASYITSAYWFTSSTSFANPAVTFARVLTDTFGGMKIDHLLPFFLAQIGGALLAFLTVKYDQMASAKL